MDTHDSKLNAPDMDDFELMRLIGLGREDALECLVKRHQQSLMNFFRRMGVYTDAEDMVQETMIRIYSSSRKYRPTAKFTTFLYTVARHVWIDSTRRARRFLAFTERMKIESPACHDGGMRNTCIRIDIEEALKRLPEKLRSVVVLSIFNGLRYDEIAEILSIPVGTVKSRMFIALDRMKESLNEK